MDYRRRCLFHGSSAEPLEEGGETCFKSDLKTVFQQAFEPQGLIIHCEDIPPINAHRPRDISTDYIAFYATADEPFCEREFPSSASFCHVSLKHAKETLHAAPYGAATSITSKVGDIACLLRFKTSRYDPIPNSEEWVIDDSWATEIIMVSPGSTLYAYSLAILNGKMTLPSDRIIPPLVPYAVVTLNHSITDGVYFFSWPYMTDSAIGFCQSFLTDTKPSKRDWDFSHLLRRIVEFFHMHLVRDFEQTGMFIFYPFFITDAQGIRQNKVNICQISTHLKA
jgi:hypothetical protein